MEYMSPNGTSITLSKTQEISQKRRHWACECVGSLTARIPAGGEPPFLGPEEEQQKLTIVKPTLHALDSCFQLKKKNENNQTFLCSTRLHNIS